MDAGERRVAGWMPILGGEGLAEPVQQVVDQRHDRVPIRDR